MAVSAYVDSVALDTATGDQTVSPGSLTFTPVGAIFGPTMLTADGGGAQCSGVTGAAASASDQRMQGMVSEDAGASTDTAGVAANVACMAGLGNNGTEDYRGDFTSFNASPAGFSFNLSNAPASAKILNYILLSGITLETFVFAVTAGAGNKSKTGLAGSPSCVIFFNQIPGLADTTNATSAIAAVSMLGWMCADGTQGYAVSGHVDGAAAADTSKRQRTDKCYGLFTGAADELVEAAFVSMDANGFTVNLANAPASTYRTYGVAIYGGVWKAGNFTSTTGTGGGNDVATTGVNPALTIVQTFGATATTSSIAGGSRGWGATDGTRRWSVAHDDVDAADPTVTDSYLDRTRALVSITAGTPTLNDAYDITHGVEKFTYDHEVASGVAIQVIYLVGGDVFVAGGVTYPQLERGIRGLGRGLVGGQ